MEATLADWIHFCWFLTLALHQQSTEMLFAKESIQKLPLNL